MVAPRSSRGFTLIEVLIASVVLFSAIAVGSMVMRTALKHLNRVSYYARVASTLYVLKDLVHEEVENKKLQGAGEWGGDFFYEWRAEPLESAMNVQNDLVYELPTPGKFRMTLYSISLSIREKGSSFKPRTFRYKELVYQKTS